MTPEFSRTVRIDLVGSAPHALAVEADAAERAALARRFDLVAIDRLCAEVTLVRSGETVTVKGTIEADVVQACVASGLPVPAAISEPFAIAFRPQPDTSADDEVELGAEEMDVVFYQGGSIDVGEAVAETLSLSLDPYPRAPDADQVLREAGVQREADAEAQREADAARRSPFAALRKH